MQQEIIEISQYQSGSASFSRLVISLPKMSPYDWCEVVVGYPGMPNVKQKMLVGDAVLYETTEDGILEVRTTAVHGTAAQFAISQVSPRFGLGAALATNDPSNLPFTEAERDRIAESIAAVKTELTASGRHSEEQLLLIYRKLDEVHAASGRLGRKDWLNYVAGSLTGLCVSAAFAPEVTRGFFQAVNSAFSWLFANAPVLLQWTSVA
ncbi:MAG: hypothetical protein Q7U63_06495 [Polaromonas sp.]|uniref:hypothetical protein n=1 Tax=Polaromonas sp. TaxID=1869339 RepID=UPI002716A1A6|nr:hypothetical protein [Polaromonas sp.]MDO9113431.1 hypothetical protein [Polaromonas sp.]MDP1886157.1 hypothetical protein [Polaromonas sp.]MDP3223469.1 hypothetical protein [Rubrivivax sp.]